MNTWFLKYSEYMDYSSLQNVAAYILDFCVEFCRKCINIYIEYEKLISLKECSIDDVKRTRKTI